MLFLIECPNASLVLGHPWLDQHNPQVDWSPQSDYVLEPVLSLLAVLVCASSPVSVSPVLQVEAAESHRGSSGVVVRSTWICGWFQQVPSHLAPFERNLKGFHNQYLSSLVLG